VEVEDQEQMSVLLDEGYLHSSDDRHVVVIRGRGAPGDQLAADRLEWCRQSSIPASAKSGSGLLFGS
jgi:hypothetical protein